MAYIGTGDGVDELTDIKKIISQGAKFSLDVAEAIFGYNIIKEAKIKVV